MISDIYPQQKPQLSLFDFQRRPVHNGTETSKEAAETAKPKIRRGQMKVLRAVLEAPEGLTRDQLSMITEMPTQTVCARANELIKLGELGPKTDSKTGKKLTRHTRTGSNAEILFAAVNTPTKPY